MNFDHKASSKNVYKLKTSRETSSKLVNDFFPTPPTLAGTKGGLEPAEPYASYAPVGNAVAATLFPR